MNTLRDERGIALVVALIIMLIVVSLGVVAVGIATHDSSQSARNRQRVIGVAAAEAGINYAYSYIQNASLHTLGPGPGDTCTWPSTSLTGGTRSSFTVTVRYYTASDPVNAIPCHNPDLLVPAFALIESVGTSIGSQPARTLQSRVNLTPVRGGAIAGTAMFSNSSITLASNLQILSAEGRDANLNAVGDVTGSTGDVIEGSIYATGTVTLSGSGGGAQVLRDVHAGGPVTLNNGFPVRRNLISSGGDITVGGRIDGDATAFGSITPANPNVGGQVVQNKTSPPPPAPPLQPFPPYVYDPADWVADGYTINSYTDTQCSEAAAFVHGAPTGKHVVRITGASATPCTFTLNQNTAIKGNLAILNDGPVTLARRFTSDGASPSYDIMLFAGMRNSAPLAAGQACPVAGNFTMNSNTLWGEGIKAVIRTPCHAQFSSNGYIKDGQIIAGSIAFASNTYLTFYPVFVPGATITGFRQDVVYTREVSST